MRFETLPQEQDRSFTFVYRNRDRALSPVPEQAGFGYSVSINEMLLELSDTGLVNHMWGYCPRESWKMTDLEPPQAAPGELRVVQDVPLVPGAAIRASKARLPVYYNERNRWLCVGYPTGDAEFRLRLAPNFVVVGNPSLITSVWVRVDRFES